MAPDLLSTICAEIAERMDGLRPLLAEHEQLLVAAAALEETHGEGKQASKSTNGTAPRARRAKRTEAAETLNADQDLDAEPTSEPASKVATRRSAKSPAAKSPRAARGAAREAILAALEHGSHTVGELSIVTAMSGPNINGNLRRLAAEGVVMKTAREGKAAWALADTVA